MKQINKLIFLLVFIVVLLLVVSNVFAAEKVTFVIKSQGNNISSNCSAIIATSGYQYNILFQGSDSGLNGSLAQGDYIAVVKLNQQSFPLIFPVQVEFTVLAGQENLVEVELKGMENTMEMASQMMKIDEFISCVQGLPKDITIMPDMDNMGDMMGDSELEMEDIANEDYSEDDNLDSELSDTDDLGIKLKVNSELVIKVKKGKVKVINHEDNYMFKQVFDEMGYSYAGEFLGKMGCIVKQGETKKFAHVTPVYN